MKKTIIHSILMRRDELTLEEANEEIENAIENFIYDSEDEEDAFSQMMLAEEALLNDLGLEPDYVMEFLELAEQFRAKKNAEKKEILKDYETEL